MTTETVFVYRVAGKVELLGIIESDPKTAWEVARREVSAYAGKGVKHAWWRSTLGVISFAAGTYVAVNKPY